MERWMRWWAKPFSRIAESLRILAAAMLVVGAGLLPAAAAETETPAAAEEIHVQADKLVANTQALQAEFSGNVRVTQGATVIASDRLRIHFASGAAGAQKEGEITESIEKIVASGNVQIRFENGLAVTQEAVYNIEANLFVLTGDGTTVTSGKNTISGRRIILDRSNGQVTVERGDNSRVEAVFYPDESDGLPGGITGPGNE
jgi:lipopolysaccharide export system protein LptA